MSDQSDLCIGATHHSAARHGNCKFNRNHQIVPWHRQPKRTHLFLDWFGSSAIIVIIITITIIIPCLQGGTVGTMVTGKKAAGCLLPAAAFSFFSDHCSVALHCFSNFSRRCLTTLSLHRLLGTGKLFSMGWATLSEGLSCFIFISDIESPVNIALCFDMF